MGLLAGCKSTESLLIVEHRRSVEGTFSFSVKLPICLKMAPNVSKAN